MATTTQAQILLLGAKSSERPLKAIPDELSKLEHLFSQNQKINEKTGIAFGIQHHPYFTQDQLKSKLNQLQNQVAILHFAGHSDAEGILSDDEAVYSRHIAGHIKTWAIPPALVVLNGCHNAGQVRLFHDAGVSVVIATHRAVNDDSAAEFARQFYSILLAHPKQTTLRQAFEQASSNALMGDNRDAVPYGRSLNIEDAEQHGWDWDVFLQDEAQREWAFYELITTARRVLDQNGKLYNPYKGLEAFQEEDQSWFFGRENVTQGLLATLLPENNARQTQRFFSLLGASGSGKSSLINAGVIPKLRKQSPNSLILHTRPGDDAFQELAKVLSKQLYPGSGSKQLDEGEAFASQLKNKPCVLPKQIQLLLNNAKAQGIRHVYLFIDQFEELFTHSEHEQIQHFLQQLVALIESDVTCTLGIIMRADFLASALAYPQFGKHINKQPHEMLSPMSETELRAAIERPAQRQQVSIENSLIENLLNDVEHQPGSLPLLQYVLSLLWEKREARQDKLIKLEDYRAFGGLEKALEQKANSVYQGLTEEQQTLCQRIFMRLVQPGDGTDDTRRRALLSEFTNASETQRIIKNLVDERLITTKSEGNKSESYIEVAHESLIRGWPRLKKWVDENRDSIRIQSRFIEAAKVWHQEGQSTSQDYVYRGALLASIEEWVEGSEVSLSDIEASFLKKSIEIRDREKNELQQRKRRKVHLIIGASAFALSLLTWFTFDNYKKVTEIQNRLTSEQNRTDIDGDLIAYGSPYGEHPFEIYLDEKHRGFFTNFLEKNIFQENTSIVEAVSLAAENMKEYSRQRPELTLETPGLSRQRPELAVSLNGKIFLNPMSKKRNLYSLVFGWSDYEGTGLTSLPGAKNDAQSIHDHMISLGYNSKLYPDTDSIEFERAITSLLEEVEEDCVPSSVDRPLSPFGVTSIKLCKNTAVFVHMAGHGLSKNGMTYAVPSDYKSGMESNEKLINIESLRARLGIKIPLRIIIADISRGDEIYETRE